MRIGRRFALPAFALASLGACCRDCEPTWDPKEALADTSQYDKALVASARQEAFAKLGDPNEVASIESVLALGAQLGAQSDYVGRLIADTSQELQNIVSEMQKSVQVVLNDLDGMLADHQDRTFDELNELEQRTFRHALTVSDKMARSIQALEVAAFEDAKVLLAEASITAYETEYNLPCRDKVARFVYAKPGHLIAWPDGREVSSDTIEARGNYLQNLAGRSVRLEGLGQDPLLLPVFSANQNGVVVKLSDDAIARMQAVDRPTTLKLAADYKYCRHTEDQKPLEATFVVRPAKRYQLFTAIKPVGTIPVLSQIVRTYSNHTGGKCDRDFADSATWPIVPPAEVAGNPTYSTSNSRCGSRVVNLYAQTRRSVTMETRIKGCGYNWIKNCKGNGVLTASVYIPVATNEEKPLAVSEDTREVIASDKIMIPYKVALPSNMVGNPKCHYYVRVKESGSDRVIEFSHLDGPVAGIAHQADAQCNLALDFPSTFNRT